MLITCVLASMWTGLIPTQIKSPVSGDETIAFVVHSHFLTIYQGKTVSCGTIIFYCLNLPPNLCYCHENTFIAGLTPPPPIPPSMVTISHVIDPVVKSALKYSTAPCPLVPTCCKPSGVEVDVKVAPLVADLEGSCKVGGFLTMAAIMFCTFCLCTQAQLEDLDLSGWILCNGHEIQEEAAIWLLTVTKSGREVQAWETGV